MVIWRLPNAASTVVRSLLNSGNLSLPFYLCTILYATSITLFYALFRKTEHHLEHNLRLPKSYASADVEIH